MPDTRYTPTLVVWPCDNYLPPLTCLTAPSSEAVRCDFCTAQVAAERERIARGTS